MNCSNCGAPMRPIAGGDRFAHFVCDFCATFHFPEKSLDSVRVIGEASALSCPVCLTGLVSASIQRQPVEHCPNCEGVLADRRAFSLIIRTLRAQHGGPRLTPQPIDPEQRARGLACPSCARGMELHPYLGPGNVMMDSCADCAIVWLDRGEIATLARS